MLVLPPGYSKQNITSVQAPALGKRNLLADGSNNHVIYRIASNRCSAVLACKKKMEGLPL